MSLPKIEYRSPISGRKSPNANLYTESSYISQYLAHSKKLYETPSTHKRHHYQQSNPLIRDYKGLAKNYTQYKYLLLQEGSNDQRIGWRKYIISGFKEKIQKLIDKQQIKNKIRIKRNYQSQGHALQKQSIREDYLCINELIQKQVPNLNIQQVEENFINQNQILLNKKMDYDEKMRRLVSQFEIIISRIEKEAFKQKIPQNYHLNMQNYNDFYKIDSDSINPYYSPRLYKNKHFDFHQKMQKSTGFNHFSEMLDAEIHKLSTLNIDFSEQLPEITQFTEQTQQMINQPEEIIEEQEEQEKGSALQTKRFEQQSEIQIKEQEIVYVEQPEIVQITQQTSRKSKRSIVNRQRKSRKSQQNEDKFDLIEYLLNLEDVHEAKLNKYFKVQQEYDSFIFMDEQEEEVYKTSVDWMDEINFGLNDY